MRAKPTPRASQTRAWHEDVAFTGATRRRLSRFEIADGGTLIIDEIATASLAVQEKTAMRCTTSMSASSPPPTSICRRSPKAAASAAIPSSAGVRRRSHPAAVMITQSAAGLTPTDRGQNWHQLLEGARGEHRHGTGGGIFADRRRSSPWGLLRAVPAPYLDCHGTSQTF
jgi:hypothetical protein